MIRIWGKIINRNRIVSQMTIPEPHEAWTLVQRVKTAMDDLILDLDLPRPIWMQKNEQEILSFGRTEFDQDHFIEPISFHHLEIEIIDEEKETGKK